MSIIQEHGGKWYIVYARGSFDGWHDWRHDRPMFTQKECLDPKCGLRPCGIGFKTKAAAEKVAAGIRFSNAERRRGRTG